MIWFWIAAGCLTVAALVPLLRPLVRPPRPGAQVEEPVAALYRRQLAAIEVELAQGRLVPEQAATARTEITRHMLAAAERETAARAASAGSASETSWRFGAAIGIAGVLPAAAIALYFAVGTPAAIGPGAATTDAAAAPHGAAELAAAADRIEAHLREAPGDLKGWTLLARTLAALSRFPEAREAYAHAIALAPGESGLHAELGEVLVLAAHGEVTAAAEAELAKAPDDPRSRYYDAEAAVQRGDTAGARQRLQALLASAPADAPWRQAVADRLAELSPNGRPTVAASAAAPPGPNAQDPGPTAPAGPGAQDGPSAQDVAAARSMSPDQRLAMIRGMVERLAEQLERNPGDRAGWARLAHAYDVLGEPDKAQAARTREAAAGPGTATTSAATADSPSADSQTDPSGVVPIDPQGWIERARSLEGLGRNADALAALKEGSARFPGNLGLLEATMSVLAQGNTDDKLTPEFVDLATQIHAIDGKEPDALWYLGLAAARSGDHYRAAAYWTTLLNGLPPGDNQRALVQHRLDSLR